MIDVIPYSPKLLDVWDHFVASSKNATFLFYRAYQEYHADRFPDNSLLFYRNNDLVALLPASRLGDEVSSHGGLTFGGILSNHFMTTTIMLEVFDALLLQLRQDRIKKLIYKSIPQFYHSLPADEDAYALFRSGARLFRRDVGSILNPRHYPAYDSGRLGSIKKAMKSGLEFRETRDFPAFWPLLEETLSAQHDARPVHSLEEIILLHSLFPANIRLFAASLENHLLAGTVVYESPRVAHAQYMASSLAGRRFCALDFVLSELIMTIYAAKSWISFGQSTDSNGTVLNEGLIKYKERFGARACVYDFNEIIL